MEEKGGGRRGSCLIFLKLQIRQKMENINSFDCFFASTLSINRRERDVRTALFSNLKAARALIVWIINCTVCTGFTVAVDTLMGVLI